MAPSSDRLTASLGSPAEPPKPVGTPHCPELHESFHHFGLIPKDLSKGFTSFAHSVLEKSWKQLEYFGTSLSSEQGHGEGGVTPGLWGKERKSSMASAQFSNEMQFL